jgi:ferredoxin
VMTTAQYPETLSFIGETLVILAEELKHFVKDKGDRSIWQMGKEKCHKYLYLISDGAVCGLCIKACPAPER